jgi:hypothetical protein
MSKEPSPGFYYHYKHDPAGIVNNYAYEVMGVGHHTEIDGLDESAMVLYRPLYEASVYKIGKHWDVRPLGMFMEDVEKNGKTMHRFTRIEDKDVIKALSDISNQMYA